MVLIDLVYINSPGGITLSKLLMDYLTECKIDSNVEILLDKRNFNFFDLYDLNKIKISKSEFSRYFFYKKYMKKYTSVLCFANVPPPLKIRSNVNIFFHNEILLNSKNLKFSYFKILLFKLKWIYIKSRNFNYTWIVQTEHIKSLIGKKLGVDSDEILKYPLFQNHKIGKYKKTENSFIYPTSDKPHKNNEILINAFKEAASKTNKKITLTLTLNKYQIDDIPQNLEIIFTGLIKHEQLMAYMKNAKFLIFPSLKESFGLPLIEGVQYKCKIITSNLNFVKELISPSYTFDPNNQRSISEVISLALSNKKHPKSYIKIKNYIDSIFNRLNNV